VAIVYEKLKNWRFDDVVQDYSWRDTVIYALGIGFGADPSNEDELRFLLEDRLVAFPTMATVLGLTPGWLAHPETGVDYLKVLHAEQQVRLYRPIPAHGTLKARTRILDIIDKGASKGAIVVNERKLYASDDSHLATVLTSSFCRADGGFGGPVTKGPEPHRIPEEPAHATLDLPTSRRSALIYRLSGDLNPIHGDPAIARRAGFKEPILHGLCTYAMAGRAVVSQYCREAPARLKALDVRFSAPVYPGETLRVELWRQGTTVSFRVRVVERDVVVLNNGRAEVED